MRASRQGLCPRCHAPTLFDAPASVAFECGKCGLDFTQYERGGRLAGVLTLLVAAVLIALALTVDVMFDPPIALLGLVFAPVTILAVIGTLRFYKTLLLYARYDKEHGR